MSVIMRFLRFHRPERLLLTEPLLTVALDDMAEQYSLQSRAQVSLHTIHLIWI